MKEIIQNRIFTKRQAKILENKLVYKSGTLFGKETEINIPYEDLMRYKESYIVVTPALTITLGVFTFITIICFAYKNDKDFEPNAWVVWGLITLFTAILFFVNRENLWKLKTSNNTYFFLFKKTPSKSKVDQFIEDVFLARDNYLKETYFRLPSKNMLYESQKNNFDWLYRIEVIDKNEHLLSIKELDNIFNIEFKKIGFN